MPWRGAWLTALSSILEFLASIVTIRRKMC